MHDREWGGATKRRETQEQRYNEIPSYREMRDELSKNHNNNKMPRTRSATKRIPCGESVSTRACGTQETNREVKRGRGDREREGERVGGEVNDGGMGKISFWSGLYSLLMKRTRSLRMKKNTTVTGR